ncbi:MAG: hypothetical protein MPL62_13405 [Alphaproteobacteria bacterium]|nr:hypothetical protein [Alphaproteobacteria bacterium]
MSNLDYWLFHEDDCKPTQTPQAFEGPQELLLSSEGPTKNVRSHDRVAMVKKRGPQVTVHLGIVSSVASDRSKCDVNWVVTDFATDAHESELPNQGEYGPFSKNNPDHSWIYQVFCL